MIPMYKVFMPKEASNGVTKVLNSGMLACGKYTKKFETHLQNYIGNPYLITLSANPIVFALKVLDIKAGDEIIVSPMSCLMTTQPIIWLGAKVIWADIDPLTGSLDPDSVKSNITKNTKAIIHYHWAGYPGYINEINSIAAEFGINVIEDATESFGAQYYNKKIGNTGSHITCFSFTPVRIPNAIDASGISFNTRELFEKAKLMIDLGIDRENFRDDIGEISTNCDIFLPGNSLKLNNVSGYVGASQVKYLDELLKAQKYNSGFWKDYFTDIVNCELVGIRKNVKPSFWAFTVLTKNRDELLLDFRRKGLMASKIHLRNDIYSVFGKNKPLLKGVEKFSSEQLNLPCGWWLNKLELKKCLSV